MNIQSQTRRIQRDGVTAQMKNKFLLFPTISCARHYHTDRSVTLLPATLRANEKASDEKCNIRHVTCSGVIKNSKRADCESIELITVEMHMGLQTLSNKKHLYLHFLCTSSDCPSNSFFFFLTREQSNSGGKISPNISC